MFAGGKYGSKGLHNFKALTKKNNTFFHIRREVEVDSGGLIRAEDIKFV